MKIPIKTNLKKGVLPKAENDPTVGSLVYELKSLKEEVISTVDTKIDEADNTLLEVKNTLSTKTKEVDEAISTLEETTVEIIEHVKTITKGEKGEDGKDGKDGKDGETPDIQLIAEKASELVKPSLKVISEEYKVEMTGEEIIPKLNSATNLKELKLSLVNISDLENLRKEINAEISRSKTYQVSGGGFNNIYNGSTLVSSGLTGLSFTGAGVSSVAQSGGIVTVTIAGGGSGSPGGSNTQLQYNNAGAFGGITGATSNGTEITLNAPTITTSLTASYATASTIAIFDGSKNLITAATATYPSLTELSYVKGVTSAIQTQLNGKQATITPAALTKADDTNVTLTLGGTPATALLQATSLTLGWTGTLAVARGGTGGGSASITLFNNITGYTASGATGTTSTNLVFSTSPSLTTPDINDATADSLQAGTASGGVSIKNNDGTTVASFGVGSSSSTNISLAGAVALGTNSITMTGSLAATGARVTKGWFTDIESTNMPTVGGTAILTSLTAPQFTTIELGHATDTTLSRSAAGQLAVEGVQVATASNTLTLTGKTIRNTVEPGTDDTYTGEDITGFNATATIAQWEAVYLSTTGWALTDADSASTAGGVMVGLAAAAGTSSNPLTVVTRGIIRNDGWTWTTVGAPLYLSTTAGALTETAPSGTDDVVRIVGYVMSDDCIFFNPSNDWITRV